jgi:hypothetical protein
VLPGATTCALRALGTGWGVFLLVRSAIVGLMDSVIRQAPLPVSTGPTDQ